MGPTYDDPVQPVVGSKAPMILPKVCDAVVIEDQARRNEICWQVFEID